MHKNDRRYWYLNSNGWVRGQLEQIGAMTRQEMNKPDGCLAVGIENDAGASSLALAHWVTSWLTSDTGALRSAYAMHGMRPSGFLSTEHGAT